MTLPSLTSLSLSTSQTNGNAMMLLEK
ncbi:hypothetical protein Nmel_004635 [Mimus melanotis]